MSFRNCLILPLLLAVAACGGARLQTLPEAAGQISRSAEQQSLKRCNQYTNMDQYHECRKRVAQEFDQVREKNR